MYTKMNVDFRLNKVMIHFKGFHELQKAVHISKIEDMSYLMIKLMKYNIAEYTEKSLKIIEDGIIIIFERISIQESLCGAPAMLPMYIVKLRHEYSDSEFD